MSTKDHRIEELLELIWTLREGGESRISEVLRQTKEEGAEGILAEMEREGLMAREGDHLTLTRAGEAQAEVVVRRHRLAERLLADVFELGEEEMESQACQFEHVLSPEVTDSVCTFLGHPPFCPHGKPIPRGRCCVKFQRELKPLVMPLSQFELGQEARIVFISPRYHARLDRLSALGIVPGSVIKLHQRQPSYVVQVGQTDLALDKEIADEIYVKGI
ncbi:MAG: metal-dependent transcriptional regulator [Anaerolineae bacterium]